MEEAVDVVRTSDAADVAQNKALGIIAYLGILCIVTIIAAKDSRFAKYHANQGLVLFLCWIAVGVLESMSFIHFLGHIAGLGITVLAIIGIINAANGEMKPLPLIGGIKILN